METIKIKVVATFNGAPAVTGFTSLPIIPDPQAKLRELNASAEDQGSTRRYYEISDREYYAVRGARAWLLTEPGDVEEDNLMRIAAHKAGMVKDPGDINVIRTDGLGDDVVELVTAKALIRIDTTRCEITEVLTMDEDLRFHN